MAMTMPDFDPSVTTPEGLFPTKLLTMPLERVGIRVYLVLITPDDAALMLKTKNNNRGMHRAQVLRIKRALEMDRWRINGEVLIFDAHGRLIEGQHRCQAGVESGVSFWSLVVHGIDFERFKTMGLGAKRSPGDIFGIAGQKDGNVLAAALRWVYRYETDQMHNQHPLINDDELIDLLPLHMPDPDNPKDTRPSIIASIAHGRQCHSVAAPGMSTALHYLCSRRDRALANAFFWHLGSGENLSKGDPILLLRRRFLGEDTLGKRSRVRSTIRDEVKAIMIALCWNLLRRTPARRLGNIQPLIPRTTGQGSFPKLL